MLIVDAANKKPGCVRYMGIARQMVRDLPKLALNPRDFYRELKADRNYGKAISFLLCCSLIHGALTGLYAPERGIIVAGIAFLNTFLSPFLIAFLLYTVAAVLCRKAFSYNAMMLILAYAGVSYLVSWIPGMSWLAGLWRILLVGTGMVSLGGISRVRAFAVLTFTVIIFLGIMRMLSPMAGPA